MKKIMLIVAVMAVIAFLIEGNSFAASAASGTVTVQATVIAQCKLVGLNNITQLVNFGSITPDETTSDQGPTALTATNVRCTNGLGYTISYVSANGGNLSDGAGHTMAYTFAPTTPAGAGTGTGFGANIPLGGTVTLTGAALQAAWSNNAIAGVTYSDTIVIDLQY